MSDRDHQNKYNKDNNFSSSMYTRVNAGQVWGNRNTNRTGSMNNTDERAPEHSTFSKTLFNLDNS